jgi:hypothetical protein
MIGLNKYSSGSEADPTVNYHGQGNHHGQGCPIRRAFRRMGTTGACTTVFCLKIRTCNGSDKMIQREDRFVVPTLAKRKDGAASLVVLRGTIAQHGWASPQSVVNERKHAATMRWPVIDS